MTVKSQCGEQQRFFVERTAKLTHQETGEMLDLLPLPWNVVLDTNRFEYAPKSADFRLAQGGKHSIGISENRNFVSHAPSSGLIGPNCHGEKDKQVRWPIIGSAEYARNPCQKMKLDA